MAFITAYKAVVITTPTAPQIRKIAAISAPSVLLTVRTITTTPVFDGPDEMHAEIGVTLTDESLFFPIWFAIIDSRAMKFTTARVALLTGAYHDPDGDMPNKPGYWGIRYQPAGYGGSIPWAAKVYFDYVK